MASIEYRIRNIESSRFAGKPSWLYSVQYEASTHMAVDGGPEPHVDVSSMIVEINDKPIYPSGAPYPAMGANCIGLNMHDVDMSAGAHEVAVLRSGIVYDERLPYELNAVTMNAPGMRNITTRHGRLGAVPVNPMP